MYKFLDGVRVVEAAAFVAGPSCTLHCQQFGAEVIRIDPIGGGPDFNRWPLSAETQSSFYWEGLNKGKKSIALDLRSDEGRELALALATAPGERSGLFVTNYPLRSFLSHDALKARRAEVISLRVMGWPDGAPAMDYTVNAAVGVPMMTGPSEDERPVNHVLPAWDLITGAYGAFALMSALHHRLATGEGSELRLPLSDVAASTMSHLGNVAEVATGPDRPRLGNELFGAFGRDFLCADNRRIVIIAITPRQWSSLIKELAITDAIRAIEHRLGVDFGGDEGARFRHRAELYDLVSQAVAPRTSSEWGSRFDTVGVTWGLYQGLKEAVEHDPRLFSDNAIFSQLEQPSGHRYLVAGPAVTVPGLARQPLQPAARLGENGEEVLATVLGLDSGAIGRLIDGGIVALPA